MFRFQLQIGDSISMSLVHSLMSFCEICVVCVWGLSKEREKNQRNKQIKINHSKYNMNILPPALLLMLRGWTTFLSSLLAIP